MRAWKLVVGLITILWIRPSLGQGGLDSSTVLQFKVLSQDLNLKARSGRHVVIGVVHRADSTDSSRSRAVLSSTLRRLAKSRPVQGLTTSVVELPFESVHDLDRRLTTTGANILVLAPGSESAASGVAKLAARRHIPTFAFFRSAIGKGIAVAVVKRGNRGSAIVVDLKAMRASGMKLSSKLLRLAEVRR